MTDAFYAFKMRMSYRTWKYKLKKYTDEEFLADFKLLEVGCGPGYFLRCFERWFPKCDLYGLDINREVVNYAVKHLKRTKLVVHDAQELPFDDKRFNILCAFQVLEHLGSPEKFFREANRVLNANGVLIISTPNPDGITAKILQDKWHGIRYDHVSLNNPKYWKGLLKANGFCILDDGSTLLSGFRILQKMPLALANWIPLAIFGYFHWYKGESYVAICRKVKDAK